MFSRSYPILAAACLAALSFTMLFAQSGASSLSGLASDPSGGVVPGARVSVIRAAGETVRQTVTAADGTFSFSGIFPGSYQLAVSADGFLTHKRDIELEPDGRLNLQVQLELDTVAQEIIVRAAPDYGSDTATTATRMPMPVLKTPRSISVLSSQVVEDQQATRFGDVLKNEASVTRTGYFLGAYEFFGIRGLSLSNGANYLRDGRVYFHLASPPVETLERIEVSKGPSSVLYGQGTPGGMVNMVTKKPTARPHYMAKFRTGSYDLYQGHLDLAGPIDEQGKLGYRANLVYENSESFRDFINVERRIGAGALSWNLSPRHQLRFNTDYLNDDRPQDTGLVAIADSVADVPISRVINNPWGHYNSNVANFGTNYSAELSRSWRMEASFNFQDFRRDRYDQQPRNLNQETGDLDIRARRRINRWEYETYNADFIGKHRVGGRDNTLLLGVNYVDVDVRNNETQRNVILPTNIFNPTFHPNPFIGTRADPNLGDDDRVGFYVQDALDITSKLSVMAGARFSVVRNQFLVAGNPDPVAEFSDEAFNPKVGLVYRLAPSVSTYVSYSESFEPNFAVTQGQNIGEQLDPTTGEQFEVGVKSRLAQDRLLVTAAYFDITRRDIPFFDNSLDLVVQRGEQVHKGFEVSASGQMTDNWTLTGSLMLLDAEFTSDPQVQGNRPGGIPDVSGSLWMRYGFTRGFLRGFAFTGGVFGEDTRFGDDFNSFRLDSYTRVDFGVTYRLPIEGVGVELQANLENAFNETYFFGSDRFSVVPGTPASGRFSLRFLF